MARLTQSGSGMTSVLDVATPFVINFELYSNITNKNFGKYRSELYLITNSNY